MTVVMFLLSAAFFLAILWLLFGGRAQSDPTQAALEIHDLLPVHCKRFPQVQHLLNLRDQSFIARRAPQKLAKQWRAERRQIIRLYIQGLSEDFRGLQKLARLLAAHSPVVKRKQEWEWLLVGVQFRLLYVATQLRFATNTLPMGEVLRLTEMLSALRLVLENTINDMTEVLPKIPSTLAS